MTAWAEVYTPCLEWIYLQIAYAHCPWERGWWFVSQQQPCKGIGIQGLVGKQSCMNGVERQVVQGKEGQEDCLRFPKNALWCVGCISGWVEDMVAGVSVFSVVGLNGQKGSSGDWAEGRVGRADIHEPRI